MKVLGSGIFRRPRTRVCWALWVEGVVGSGILTAVRTLAREGPAHLHPATVQGVDWRGQARPGGKQISGVRDQEGCRRWDVML